MKKDIITITGLTAEDGSVVTAGAHMVLEIEFPVQFNGYLSRIYVYRNKQIFENGYAPIRIMDLEEEMVVETTEDVAISTIHSEMVAFINDQFDQPVCEIVE